MNWMLNIFASLMIAIGLTVPASAYEPKLGATVAIYNPHEGGSCSAVHLGDGLFLTARHCFTINKKIPESMQVRVNGVTGYYRVGDMSKDYAFFNAPGYDGPAATHSCIKLKLFQDIWGESFPGTIAHAVVVGKVASLSMLNQVAVDMPVAPGGSGGAVFNTENELVGVQTAYLNGNMSFGLITPVTTIPELCPDGGIDMDALVSELNKKLQETGARIQ